MCVEKQAVCFPLCFEYDYDCESSGIYIAGSRGGHSAGKGERGEEPYTVHRQPVPDQR